MAAGFVKVLVSVMGFRFLWGVSGSLIADAKIIYSKSKKIQERFEEIQKLVPSGWKKNLEQTIERFDCVYGGLWRLQKAVKDNHQIDAAFIISDLANWMTHTLACLNKTYMKNNWGKQLNEVAKFDILPDDFIDRYKKLVNSTPAEALEIATDLIDDINLLLREYQRNEEKITTEDINELATEWPGVIEYCNKAISAAEKSDTIAGLYAAKDNAEYYLWAFSLLQGRKWGRNSFHTSSEEVVNFSVLISENITKLATSRNLVELKESTEKLSEMLTEELKLRRLKIPLATSYLDALQFMQIKDIE